MRCVADMNPIKTEIVSFRIGPKLRAELERQAFDAEMSLGEFVRAILIAHAKATREQVA